MYSSICFSLGLSLWTLWNICSSFLLRSVRVAIWLNQDGVVFQAKAKNNALVIDFCTFGGS